MSSHHCKYSQYKGKVSSEEKYATSKVNYLYFALPLHRPTTEEKNPQR